MKYRFFLIFALIPVIFLSPSSELYSMTGNEALESFQNRMDGIPKMTGIISWTAGSGQNYTASFKYMSPGKIYVKFNSPRGKTIVSNGKKLWIYDSNSNICGIQELGAGNSGGISALTRGYLAIVSQQGSKGYTIKLKNNDRNFSQITLMLDSTFLLKKAVLKDKQGSSLSFSLSNISTSAAVMKNLFDFSVPANAQTVINPLNTR